MQINPDRDLLIFKIREERLNDSIAKKSVLHILHNVTFNSITENSRNTKDSLLSGVMDSFHKIIKHKITNQKTKESGSTQTPVSETNYSPTNYEPQKQSQTFETKEESVQATSTNKTKQLQDMQEKVNNMLKTMQKINDRQKIISEG